MFLKFQDFKPNITFCHWKSKGNKKLQPNKQICYSKMSFVNSKQICLWKEKSLRVDQKSQESMNVREIGANTRKHEQITLK